jgi:hypothetical protein
MTKKKKVYTSPLEFDVDFFPKSIQNKIPILNIDKDIHLELKTRIKKLLS